MHCVFTYILEVFFHVYSLRLFYVKFLFEYLTQSLVACNRGLIEALAWPEF